MQFIHIFFFSLFIASIHGFNHISHFAINRSAQLKKISNYPSLPHSKELRNKVPRSQLRLDMMNQPGQYTSFWGMFVTTLQFAGPMFFLSLQGSSVMTAKGIYKNRSSGDLSPLPFISLFTNSFIWSLYGFLKMDPTVLIPNGCGVFSSLYCILAFHKNAIIKPKKLYVGSIMIVLGALLLALFNKVRFIGILGCILSVLLSASPLAVLQTVIRDKSTKSLPFVTSFVIWLNSISWLLYGVLVAHDILIYGPNILGFVLASIQMTLFGMYGIEKPALSKVISKV
jgi:solute carrier family 50 protein (sugar transporter)